MPQPCFSEIGDRVPLACFKTKTLKQNFLGRGNKKEHRVTGKILEESENAVCKAIPVRRSLVFCHSILPEGM